MVWMRPVIIIKLRMGIKLLFGHFSTRFSVHSSVINIKLFFFFLSLNLSFCGFIFPSIKSFYSFPIAVYALAVDSAVSDCWFLCIIFTSRDLYRNVTNLSVWGIFYLYSSFFFVLHMWQWWDFWFCAEHFVDLIPLQIWIQGSHHKLIHNFIKITCICIFSANHTRWGFWFIRQCFPII